MSPVSGPPTTFRDYVAWGERELRRARVYCGHGTDNARDEAAWLVGATLRLPPSEWDAHAGDVLTARQRAAIEKIIRARIETRKPAAYLLNEAWFAGLRFHVDERVIVPRSLIGEFIPVRFRPWVQPRRVHRILDLCTGSGCIAIAAARVFPRAIVDAVDVSRDTLAVARINVKRHGVSERVNLIQSDLFGRLRGRQYDLILSNPPYVDARDMARLPSEFRHEPRLALAAGKEGLDLVARIIAEAPAYLTPHGALICEVGNSRAALVKRFRRVPFTWLSTSTGDDSVFLLPRQSWAALTSTSARGTGRSVHRA